MRCWPKVALRSFLFGSLAVIACAGPPFVSGGEAGSGQGGASGAPQVGEGGRGGTAAQGGTAASAGGNETGELGGQGGQGGENGESCDPSSSPELEPCLLTDERAVFVSPDGDDAGAGTREDPVRTLTVGILRAARERRIVVACAGVFRSPLRVMTALRLYGGYTCDGTWAPSNQRTVVQPTPGEPALTLDRVDSEVVIEGFEFRARVPDDPPAGASAIAAIVSNAERLVLRNALFVAGNGANGESAGAPMDFATQAARGRQGSGRFGGEPVSCACQVGEGSRGGGGGQGADAVGAATAGMPGSPSYDDEGGVGGVPGRACEDGGSGKRGSDAPSSSAIETGAKMLGEWDAEARRWIPGSGARGADGLPGEGGGGGRGGPAVDLEPDGWGGGGGACGGCGGRGGGAGGGGGASIGLLVLDSNLSFQSGAIVTGDAGAGGAGAPGQNGQEGGEPGPNVGTSCPGGSGGRGSNGAPGGGGAGGIAVGILSLGGGTLTLSESVTIELGSFGPGGVGGDATVDVDDGIDGRAELILEL